MIDKINGNDSYDFHGSSTNKRKSPAVRAYEDTPGFDAAQKRAAGIHKKNGNEPEQKETGVILDLSSKSAEKNKQVPAAKQKKDSFWSGALRKLISPVVRWLKDFWESDHSTPSDMELPEVEEPEINMPEDSESADIEPSAAEIVSAETGSELSSLEESDQAHKQTKIADEIIKSGDLQQIEQLLTENGLKRLAHNSDLLTYYDRRGKFVEMDETEKHRVLFGDKNVLKL